METDNIQNLLNSEFIQNTIIDQSPTAIIIATAPKGEIVYGNKAAWDFRGESTDKNTSININSWKAYNKQGKLYAFNKRPIIRSLTNGEIVYGEEVLIKLNNSTKKWALAYTAPIYQENKIIAAIAIFSDITQHIQSKLKLEELNETKLKILGVIAHDLKTPFNALIGFSELLIESIQNKDLETAEQYAHILKNAANTAYLMTHDLIEWSNYRETVDSDIKEHNLLNFAQKITKQLQVNSTQKNILILIDVSETISAYFDENTLGITFRNLLSNAIKFSHKNSTIEVNIKEKNAHIVFSITDYGIGIPPAKLKTLLINPKLNNSTPGTNGEIGSGLGLCICLEMIRKHEGKIWVESELHKKTTFYFSFPKTLTT